MTSPSNVTKNHPHIAPMQLTLWRIIPHLVVEKPNFRFVPFLQVGYPVYI